MVQKVVNLTTLEETCEHMVLFNFRMDKKNGKLSMLFFLLDKQQSILKPPKRTLGEPKVYRRYTQGTSKGKQEKKTTNHPHTRHQKAHLQFIQNKKSINDLDLSTQYILTQEQRLLRKVDFILLIEISTPSKANLFLSGYRIPKKTKGAAIQAFLWALQRLLKGTSTKSIYIGKEMGQSSPVYNLIKRTTMSKQKLR